MSHGAATLLSTNSSQTAKLSLVSFKLKASLEHNMQITKKCRNDGSPYVWFTLALSDAVDDDHFYGAVTRWIDRRSSFNSLLKLLLDYADLQSCEEVFEDAGLNPDLASSRDSESESQSLSLRV